jgi:methanogenic corrinoid protein MtbC1
MYGDAGDDMFAWASTDVVIETFVYKNNVFNVETIELSALLSTTTVKQQSIIEALEKFGLWPLMKVIF